MQDHIKTYYRGERISSAIFFGYGTLSLVGSYLYYIYKQTPLATGLFYCIGLIGLGIIVIGIARFWKSIRFFNAASTDENQSYLKTNEYNRLVIKDKKYQHMRTIMTAGIGLSFTCLVISAFTGVNDFLVGTALGIALNCGYILAFDLFAQFRMKEYMHHLEKLL